MKRLKLLVTILTILVTSNLFSGTSFEFNGSNFIEIQNSYNIFNWIESVNDFTIETWVNIKKWSISGAPNFTIFDKYNRLELTANYIGFASDVDLVSINYNFNLNQ